MSNEKNLHQTVEELQIANEELITLNEQLEESLFYNEALNRKLQESEKKYRSLFENMIDGFALHEIICDSSGIPIDYIFLDINPAFTKMTGLDRSIIGKRVLDVLPDTEHYWIETYGNVALTGESVSYENYSKEFGKWYNVTAFQSGERRFATVFEDITIRMKALIKQKEIQEELCAKQAHLCEVLDQKETLLKEVHHRVKNNMQIISSLLNLEAKKIASEEISNFLEESKNRIRAMALVHEQVYQSKNLSGIYFDEYIKDLINYYQSNFCTSIRIDFIIDVEKVHISLDAAIPLSLITNEIVTNSVKYAFEGVDNPEIKIKLHKNGNFYDYIISDNGIGLNCEETSDESKESLGTQLITGLAKQLGAKIKNTCIEGVSYTITIPEKKFVRDES